MEPVWLTRTTRLSSFHRNLEVQQVAVADDVVMRHHPRGGGHRT